MSSPGAQKERNSFWSMIKIVVTECWTNPMTKGLKMDNIWCRKFQIKLIKHNLTQGALNWGAIYTLNCIELKFTFIIVMGASVPLATGSGCFLADGVSLASPLPGRGNRMFTDPQWGMHWLAAQNNNLVAMKLAMLTFHSVCCRKLHIQPHRVLLYERSTIITRHSAH